VTVSDQLARFLLEMTSTNVDPHSLTRWRGFRLERERYALTTQALEATRINQANPRLPTAESFCRGWGGSPHQPPCHRPPAWVKKWRARCWYEAHGSFGRWWHGDQGHERRYTFHGRPACLRPVQTRKSRDLPLVMCASWRPVSRRRESTPDRARRYQNIFCSAASPPTSS